MIRKRSDTGWRAMAFAVALFAITLNFLQPLAHAALMRDGGPVAAAQMWGAFCLTSDDGQNDAAGSLPGDRLHECCLGLAHAPAMATPPTAFVVVDPVEVAAPVVADKDVYSPTGIRDGPSQPRAPPFFA